MMIDFEAFVTIGAPALAGIGASFIVYASIRDRARKARSRRLVRAVGMDSHREADMSQRQVLWSRFDGPRQRLIQTLTAHQMAATRVSMAVIVVGALLGILNGSPGWSVPVVAAVGIIVWLRRLSATHNRLEKQAPGALEMLSAGLRAGYSVPQAIAMVARESPEPTATAFGSVGRELAVGSSLTNSLTHLAERTALADYTLVSTVVWIHAQVGGNLAVVLDSVVVTLRSRFDLREQVRALTAQQRMASSTLTMLPVGVLLLLLIVDRPFVDPLFSLPVGRLLLGIGCALLAAGWGMMRLVTRVEL